MHALCLISSTDENVSYEWAKLKLTWVTNHGDRTKSTMLHRIYSWRHFIRLWALYTVECRLWSPCLSFTSHSSNMHSMFSLNMKCLRNFSFFQLQLVHCSYAVRLIFPSSSLCISPLSFGECYFRTFLILFTCCLVALGGCRNLGPHNIHKSTE